MRSCVRGGSCGAPEPHHFIVFASQVY
jgi:hypothetical protein